MALNFQGHEEKTRRYGCSFSASIFPSCPLSPFDNLLYKVGEVVFYLRKTREQFRIKGRLIVVSASESDEQLIKARNQQWKQISPASKASFATSHIPGLELSAQENSDATSTTDEQKGRGEEIEVVDIPDTVENFSLVLLWPYNVDHLVLKDGQHRYVHSLVKEHDEIFPVWKTVAVNP